MNNSELRKLIECVVFISESMARIKELINSIEKRMYDINNKYTEMLIILDKETKGGEDGCDLPSLS